MGGDSEGDYIDRMTGCLTVARTGCLLGTLSPHLVETIPVSKTEMLGCRVV